MAKRTHKLKGLSDVAQVVASAPNMAAAAKKLGVNRSTLHRWLQTGKVAKPEPKQGPAAGATPDQSPDEWSKAVRELGELDATASTLVDLAVAALAMSRDVTNRPETRLSAMGRYQQIVKQLNLDSSASAAGVKPQVPQARTMPRRTGTDPRNILMAVK